MLVHLRKCEPEPFEAIAKGLKSFEWRKEDRPGAPFTVGDLLVLREFKPDPELPEGGSYARVLARRISYVLRGRYGVPEGFVVLGLEKMP